MTMYCKGIYFARDSSFSSSPTYSAPNAQGVQHTILCRVAVGEYYKSVQNALTQAAQHSSVLSYSTVDDSWHGQLQNLRLLP